MITLLQTQGQGQGEWLTQSDKLVIISVWGVLAIISANILLHVWKGEGKLTLLSYFGAWTFGTLMAPVITPIALLGWMGTITPYQAKTWIRERVRFIKEVIWDNTLMGWGWKKWFSKAKQAPPQFTTATNSGIVINPNPQAIYTTTFGPPYINDAMNPKPVSHPVPNMGRGTRSGPNAMTRLSNGSYGKNTAPSWYVPAVKAKKAAK